MLATMSGNPFVFGVLFLLLVLGIGLALVWTAERSPAAPFFQRSIGIVSAFANTLAVLFGLLTAFLANDVWMQVEKARAAALAVTLYTLAMAFTLWVILARLDPFAGWTPLSLQPIEAAIAPPG